LDQTTNGYHNESAPPTQPQPPTGPLPLPNTPPPAMRRGGYREESIYSLVPPEEVVAKKPPMYKSPFAPPVMEKKAFGMMGREVPKPNPSEFMKAGSKTTNIKLPAPKAFIRDEEKKPGVPTREEKPIYGLKTSKNYITANAVENILQAPRRLAGSEAKFTDKEDYGRVPEYLQRIKQERKEEDDFITHIQQVRREQTGMKILPEEERLKILGGLKDRWTELNKQYISGTSVVIGTERARLRKENLEAQLTQVEKDIEKMSKKNIVIQEQQQYDYY